MKNQKTLIKVDRNGSKHYEGMVECDRCQGKGYYVIGVCNNQPVLSPLDNGVCWRCGGTGTVHGKWIERTPEYQAKLDAKRAERQAKKQAEWEAERAKYEAERREREAKAEQERLAREAEIKAQKAISQHVGEVGERMALTVTFDHSAWYEAHIGWMTQTVYIHTFKDSEGNVLIWKTSSNSLGNLEEGQQVTLTGTVKEHSVYKDEKQTALTRCKVSPIAE